MGSRQFTHLLIWGLCLVLAFSLAAFSRPTATEKLERMALDYHYSMVPTPREQEEIVLVLAGEPTFRELGEWPWSRQHHAHLLGQLGLSRILLLDIVMPETSDPEADSLLATVVKTLGNVVVAYHTAEDPSGNTQVVYPHPSLLEAAANIGVTNVNVDVDGSLRFIKPVWNINGKGVVSFPMAALQLLGGEPPALTTTDSGYELRAAGRSIPLDAHGNMLVQTSSAPIKRYEYMDVLRGTVPPETFQDKIVVVGVAASGASDFHLVAIPFGAVEMAGAEFNAKALATMLYGYVPIRVSPTVSALLAGLLALIGTLLGTRKPVFAFPGVLGAGCVYLLAAHELFVFEVCWIDSAMPLMAMAGTFLIIQGLRYSVVHKDWELKSISLSHIANMGSLDAQEYDSFSDLLKSAWPNIVGNTAIELVDPSVTKSTLDKRFLKTGEGQLTVARPGPDTFLYGLALPVPNGDEDTQYVLLGWNRPVTEETLEALSAVILSTAWFFTNMQEAKERKDLLFRTIRSIFRALDYRDPITGGHSNRVSSLSLEIMAHMDLTDSKLVEDIYLGSLVHDVGKIGIPDSVLMKEGKLTEDEFAYIRTHPTIGAEIMESVKLPKEAMRTLVEHHERYDGSGYPARLSGETISIGGRITAVADVFDALTSDRPYRTGWAADKACNYIQSMRGTHFDPQVVDAFLDLKGMKRKEQE